MMTFEQWLMKRANMDYSTYKLIPYEIQKKLRNQYKNYVLSNQ